MRTEVEKDLLQAIFDEMQMLKKAMAQRDERCVSVKEFADRLGISEPTLWNRIKDGEIKKPFKNGRLAQWLNSYVNETIAKLENSDKLAA